MKLIRGIEPKWSWMLESAVIGISGYVFFKFADLISLAYGWAVFVALPIGVGFFGALFAPRGPALRPFRRCLGSAYGSLGVLGLAMFLWGGEGLECLLMALPFVVLLVLIGVGLGYLISCATRSGKDKRAPTFVVLGFLPLMLTKDAVAPAPNTAHKETTVMVVNAPPEKIWPYLSNLNTLKEPIETLLRFGIAYPQRIQTDYAGVGGRRHCRLSTGDMPETIEVFEPNRRLDFRVIDTPPCMVETSPYGKIQTKHLTGYFRVLKGQFLLEPLPGGRTRMVGTSWYVSRYAPDIYWSLWTDSVVEEVHQRVMKEIKMQAEFMTSRP